MADTHSPASANDRAPTESNLGNLGHGISLVKAQPVAPGFCVPVVAKGYPLEP
jgi:hypothetical protein